MTETDIDATKDNASHGVEAQRIVMLFHYDGMLWTRCKLRKTMSDYFGGHIAKGKYAYRPLTNGYDRMKRLETVPMHAKIISQHNACLSHGDGDATSTHQKSWKLPLKLR